MIQKTAVIISDKLYIATLDENGGEVYSPTDDDRIETLQMRDALIYCFPEDVDGDTNWSGFVWTILFDYGCDFAIAVRDAGTGKYIFYMGDNLYNLELVPKRLGPEH